MKFLRASISLLLIWSIGANADIQTDKDAGVCAGYLTALRKPKGAEKALGMADNPRRATQFALNWFGEIKRAGGMNTVLAVSADRACRNVGIRALSEPS